MVLWITCTSPFQESKSHPTQKQITKKTHNDSWHRIEANAQKNHRKKNIKPDLTFNVEFLKARTTKSLNRRAVAHAAAPGRLATTQSGVVDGRNTARLAALVGSARTSAMANRTLPLEAWLEDAERWQLYCKCECIIYSIYIEKKVLGKQSLLCTHFLCKCVCVHRWCIWQCEIWVFQAYPNDSYL